MSAAEPADNLDLEMKELAYLPVGAIDRNERNPRLHFPEEVQERLTQSIDEKGVLVPIAVYRNPEDPERYVLIDGERRWLCSQRLAIEKIPAVIREQASDSEILLEMFNIHMVREPWANMPTAWAIKRVVDEFGTDDPGELSRLTGLSTDQIRRLLHALELPEEYQVYIDDATIPLNFFWELKTRVIDPLARMRPNLTDEFGVDGVLHAFVGKRLASVITDVVSLRKVQPIIKLAAEMAADPHAVSPLDEAIRELVLNEEVTIEEAYEDSVELAVETEKLIKKGSRLIRSYELLLNKATAPERAALVEIAEKHIVGLQDLLDL